MSSYIKLSTLEFPRHLGDIELDPAGMADYALVEWVEPPTYDPKTQRCDRKDPQQIDGVWYFVWEVRDATQGEIDAHNKFIEQMQNRNRNVNR